LTGNSERRDTAAGQAGAQRVEAWWVNPALYTPITFLARVALRLFFRLKVRGYENIPHGVGVVIASNHQSYLDPIIIGVSNDEPVTFMARESLFRKRLFGWLIRRTGAFPVKRGSADRSAMHEAIRRLRAGARLVVFPEGTRTLDGSLGRVRSGPALLAEKAQVPIVPAVIRGAYEAWPRSRKLFRFRPISITYGRPIAAPAAGKGGAREELTRNLQDSLESLMAETQ